jgi:hypothetical protein
MKHVSLVSCSTGKNKMIEWWNYVRFLMTEECALKLLNVVFLTLVQQLKTSYKLQQFWTWAVKLRNMRQTKRPYVTWHRTRPRHTVKLQMPLSGFILCAVSALALRLYSGAGQCGCVLASSTFRNQRQKVIRSPYPEHNINRFKTHARCYVLLNFCGILYHHMPFISLTSWS